MHLAAGLLLAAVASSAAGAQANAKSKSLQIDTFIQAATQQLQQGNTVQAEDLLQHALSLDPASVAANDTYGDFLVQRQHLPEAMDRFETALATDPHDPHARSAERNAAVALALHARNAGSNDAALLCLQHARAALPDDPEILLDIGIQARDMHRLGISSEALQAGLVLDPKNPKLLYAMARTEVDQEHFPDAKAHYLSYLDLKPDDATAHYGLGHLYQMQQQTDLAAQQFQQSIALLPVQTESYFQLGQIALDAHRNAEARAAFEKTLSRMPAHGGALTGMGIIAYREKNYAASEQYLTKAIAAAPDYQPAHYYLGLTLRRLGKQDDAQKELQTASTLAATQQGKGQPMQAP